MNRVMIPTKHKMSKHHEDFVKAALKDERSLVFLPRIVGKTVIMDELKRQKFYHNVKDLIQVLHSNHPNDKDIVQELLGKMTEQEILLMREMLVTVGKVFYVKGK